MHNKKVLWQYMKIIVFSIHSLISYTFGFESQCLGTSKFHFWIGYSRISNARPRHLRIYAGHKLSRWHEVRLFFRRKGSMARFGFWFCFPFRWWGVLDWCLDTDHVKRQSTGETWQRLVFCQSFFLCWMNLEIQLHNLQPRVFRNQVWPRLRGWTCDFVRGLRR